jgi:hypothetical protein
MSVTDGDGLLANLTPKRNDRKRLGDLNNLNEETQVLSFNACFTCRAEAA